MALHTAILILVSFVLGTLLDSAIHKLPILFSSFGKRKQAKTSNNTAKDKAVIVEGLANFDFTKVEPISYRPFLNKKHLFMGIANCPRNDWIQIDRGYLDRLAERKVTVEAHAAEAIGSNAISSPAVKELFLKVIEHISIRFPTMFQLHGSIFRNLVTGVVYNIKETTKQPTDMLRMLSENVEEDFFFMCPNGNGEFCLQGYIACFPKGFLSRGRVGKSMAEIHHPVPGYRERISKGADRFMTRLQGGNIIQRNNWSIQRDGPDLYRLDGNNWYPDKGEIVPVEPETIAIKQCYLRVERQALICLDESKAIVFCVRSYITHLEAIKKEGNALELAEALDSMPETLGYYKMRPLWERDIYAFLRPGSQID